MNQNPIEESNARIQSYLKARRIRDFKEQTDDTLPGLLRGILEEALGLGAESWVDSISDGRYLANVTLSDGMEVNMQVCAWWTAETAAKELAESLPPRYLKHIGK
jgi:hypothetical protein